MEQIKDIENILMEYYKKRKMIENNFNYRYYNTVNIRINNLTIKYANKIKNINHNEKI